MKLDLQADLSQHQLDFLPPQLQLSIRDSTGASKVAANTNATISFAAVSRRKESFSLNVENLNLQSNTAHLPVDSLTMAARLENEQLSADAKLKSMSRSIRMHGESSLNARMDVRCWRSI